MSVLQEAVADSMAAKQVLFVPVDAPLLSPELLASLLQAAQGNGDGARTPASPLPVVLKTTEAVLQRCEQVFADLESGRSCSVKRFIEPLNLFEIDHTDAIASQLINVNTPAQWEGLLHELEIRT